MKATEMTTQHIVNRIAWLKRQQVDPWDVMGDYYKGSYSRACIQDDYDRIEKEVEALEQELVVRGETNQMNLRNEIEKLLSPADGHTINPELTKTNKIAFTTEGRDIFIDQILSLLESLLPPEVEPNNLREILEASEKYMPNTDDELKVVKLDPATWNACLQEIRSKMK